MSEWKEKAIQLSCDVIVVGAGPAGISAAIKARDHGLDVIVLDKADPKWSGSAGRGIDLLHSLGVRGGTETPEGAIKSSQFSYKRCYDEPDLANENVIYKLWEKED